MQGRKPQNYTKNSIKQRFANLDLKTTIEANDLQATANAMFEAMSDKIKGNQLHGTSTQFNTTEPGLTSRNFNATQNSFMNQTFNQRSQLSNAFDSARNAINEFESTQLS